MKFNVLLGILLMAFAYLLGVFMIIGGLRAAHNEPSWVMLINAGVWLLAILPIASLIENYAVELINR